jgi:nucleotide-binding universal stress UspA family protein
MDRGRLLCAVTDDEAAPDVVSTGNAIGAATGLAPVFATVAEVEVAPSSTVIPAAPGIGWAPFTEGGFYAAERRAAERAEEFLSGLRLDHADTHVCIGSATSELDGLAQDMDAAAVVVGGKPGGAMKAIAMGDVARWLAVNGSRPVVFARPAGRLDMSGPVVCGIEPRSDDASRVAAIAGRFADLLERSLVLVHVGYFGASEARDVLAFDSRLGDARRAARRELDRIASELDVAAPTEIDVDDGPEAERLAAQAENRAASLLVTGNRGLGPIRSSLAGSVSLELARSARTPVVVVPPVPRGA